MQFNKIACIASDSEKAQKALIALGKKYDFVSVAEADVIVTLGGDGSLLSAIHDHHHTGLPFYGMNRGSVGFLLNSYSEFDLHERLNNAHGVTLRPLCMTASTVTGTTLNAMAFNEVALLRTSQQSAHIRVLINGKERLDNLVCDGIMVSTPAGSTAYNLSARGPIIPVGSNVLALTPVSPFRPRRWNGALLPHSAEVTFQILEAAKRPVNASADFFEVDDVIEVSIREDHSQSMTVLFDPDHCLEERIFSEQFAY